MQQLKLKEEETQRRIEEATRAPTDPFKMRKFQNVESKVKGDLVRQSLKDDLRPIVEG